MWRGKFPDLEFYGLRFTDKTSEAVETHKTGIISKVLVY